MLKQIRELVPGDLVDLEGDPYADANPDSLWHIVFPFELQTVFDVEPETPDCACVYFNGFACGFPPGHRVRVEGHIPGVVPG